jgi:glycosyltransferase involved in cell wall biosynthesis
MRILQVGNYYPSHGGISALLEDLATCLRGDGHHVDVLSVGRNHRVRGPVSLALSARRYDIIHCHATWRKGALPAYLVATANMRRTPALLTYHGFHGFPHWFTKWVMSEYQWTTTVDPFARDAFEQHFRRARITHVPNLFDTSRWPYSRRDALRPRLVWLRGYRPPELAFRTFALVRARYPGTTLTLCGSVATAEQWPEYAREPGVKLLGDVPREQLPAILSESDICLNTFSNDSFGYSVYEPMAMGLAVVSVESPVLRREAASAIKFCEPESPRDMADAVGGLIDDPEAARAQVAAGRQVIHEVSWEVLRTRWYAIYRSLCGGGDGDSPKG